MNCNFSEDDKNSRRDRYAGPITEFTEKRHYKPEVKLDYIDDGGKILSQKEAFRYLSHKFHGKGSGKNKIEKRMNKKMQGHVSYIQCYHRIKIFMNNFQVEMYHLRQ